MGDGSHGQWGTGVWGIWAMEAHWGYGVQGTGVWGTWAIGAQGVWGTRGMGHVGNEAHMGVIGYRATGRMGRMGDLLPKWIKKMSRMSKKCQVVKEDVKCQKFKHLDYGGGSQKN